MSSNFEDRARIGELEAMLEIEKKKNEDLSGELEAEKEKTVAGEEKGEERMSRLEESMSKKMDEMAEKFQGQLSTVLSLQTEESRKESTSASKVQDPPPPPVAHVAPASPTHTTASSRVTQEPTPAMTTMLDVSEDLLYSQAGLNPIVAQEPKYSKLLDYRRYRLAPSKMNSASTVPIDKLKHYFPLTTRCVNGKPFDGNGPEPEKPLAGSVLTFLKCLTVEAYSSNLTEGDLQRGMTYLVGPTVANSLMREGLKPSSRVHSYCGQVSWLLQTFANEKDLRLAESRLGLFRQGPDESPRSFQERLVSSMGHLKGDEELKSQFLYGVGTGAQASLTALKRDFQSSWEDLISAADAGDYGRRAAAVATKTRRSVNLVADTTPSQSPMSEPEEVPTDAREESATDDMTGILHELLTIESRHWEKKDIVCYLCFEPGHVVADCKVLPEKEMKMLLERRAKFLSEKKKPYSRNFTRAPRQFPSTTGSGLPRVPSRSFDRRQDF